MAENNGLLWAILALAVVSILVSSIMVFGNKEVTVPPIPAPEITDQDKADIASAAAQLVVANIPAPAPTPQPIITDASDGSEPLDNDKIDALYKDSKIDDELKAEEIAMAELNSKDFKKQLKDVLNAEILLLSNDNHDQYGLQIDSYKDIEDVYNVNTEEVKVWHGKGYVEIEFKVSYILDDDEDEVAKARLTIKYTIEDLDEDEEFVDAEITEDFEVLAIKLYG